MDSLYHRLTEQRFRPTELTAGPWDPGMQHGGPPAALVMHRLAEVDTDADAAWTLARLTVDILRPIPLTDLTVAVSVLRPGRRVRLIGVTVDTDELRVAEGRAWQFHRGGDVPVPDDVPASPPSPLTSPRVAPPESYGPGFHRDAIELRIHRGGFEVPGRGIGWGRLLVNVVDDVAVTPLERLAATADMGNGLSTYLDLHDHYFINTDLTIHVTRRPEGEWIGLDSVTLGGAPGSGVTTSTLFDTAGLVGSATQTLLIAARER